MFSVASKLALLSHSQSDQKYGAEMYTNALTDTRMLDFLH